MEHWDEQLPDWIEIIDKEFAENKICSDVYEFEEKYGESLPKHKFFNHNTVVQNEWNKYSERAILILKIKIKYRQKQIADSETRYLAPGIPWPLEKKGERHEK